VVDYYLKIASAAGVTIGDAEFVLPTKDDSEKTVLQMLKQSGVDDTNYAVFIPGSAHADKCWAAKNFAILADKIAERFGFSIVTAGTKGENSICNEIESRANTAIINFAGKTNIPMLVELLRNARLVVSNDTGPGQIAAALKVPLAMVFGRSNPVRVAPYRRSECIAAAELEDRGDSINNFEDKYDIKHVTVDMVFKKACAQLK
jgi:ADP-heptose:LPS heptosyltransferase